MRIRLSEDKAEVKIKDKVKVEVKVKVETICTRVLQICLYGKCLSIFL